MVDNGEILERTAYRNEVTGGARLAPARDAGATPTSRWSCAHSCAAATTRYPRHGAYALPPGLNGEFAIGPSDTLRSRMAPPVNRTPMAPHAWPLRTVFSRFVSDRRGTQPSAWQRAGAIRRALLLGYS